MRYVPFGHLRNLLALWKGVLRVLFLDLFHRQTRGYRRHRDICFQTGSCCLCIHFRFVDFLGFVDFHHCKSVAHSDMGTKIYEVNLLSKLTIKIDLKIGLYYSYFLTQVLDWFQNWIRLWMPWLGHKDFLGSGSSPNCNGKHLDCL